MSGLRQFLRRLRGLAATRDLDRDLRDEIASHLEEATDEYLRRGLSVSEARQAALRRFGGVTQTEDAYRDLRSFRWIDDVRRDLRHARRVLWTQPAMAGAILVSLALGIGANTAIFSLLNGLMLKSLPVKDPDRLVRVTPGGNFGSWTYPLWTELRDRQDVLDDVFAWSSQRAAFDLSTGGASDASNGLWVSANFFDALGVAPLLGRTFVAADDTIGGGPDGPVAIVSYRFWQRRFGGAADVIGKSLSIERMPFRIVGVTPSGFLGPNVGSAFDVAIPIGTQPLVLRRNRLDQRTWWWLSVMGRLKPGQTTDAAAAGLARLQPIMRELTRPEGMRPEEAASYLGTPIGVEPAPGGPSSLRDDYKQALAALMGIVGLVLLVACVNVANLLLAHAERRRPEVSLQLALGASRRQLVRQSLIETLALSSLGALIGLAIAGWGSGWLVRQLPAPAGAAFLDVSLDWRVLAFTTALATVVALLCGTFPALHATHADPMDALRGRRGGVSSGHGRIGSALVTIQFALCLVLVVSAGLFVRTFTSLTGRDTGLDRDRILIVNIDARRSALASAERGVALYDRVLEAVRALPGVAGASYSAVTPVSSNTWDTTIENPSGLSLPEQDRQVYKNEIAPGWFATYGTPLLTGRDFTRLDQAEAQGVAIVNEAFARRYFGGSNPVGLTIREVGRPSQATPALTIVGLVKDSVYLSLRERAAPTMYLPAAFGSGALSVRAESRSPSQLIPLVTAAIGGVDTDLSLTLRPLAEDLALSSARERLLALLAAFFGVLALLLAGVGLYGVVSYRVGARRKEIGIRLALGASRGRVVALVVRRTALLMGVGVLIGVPAGMATARVSASLLFGITPYDPATHASAVVLLAAVGVAAAWAPARRAANLNPATTLRAE